ncbi:MAG: nucleotide exchange factor GrpE [Phycisphaerales bacterium]|jgi:molecular chaperone GrpE
MNDENQNPNPSSDSDAGSMQEKLAQLTAELDDAKARALRLMADYQNYQRRAYLNEDVAKQQGIASVVTSVVPVLDHFDLALMQDPSKASAEQIMAGVRVIREELLKALAQRGVGVIAPQPNDEFNPGRHEAVMQQPADGIFPGHIVQCFQLGYTLGPERVLRPAKVVVAPAE